MERRSKSPSRIPTPRSPSPAARSRVHNILKTILPSQSRTNSKAQPDVATRTPQAQPDINVHLSDDETATKTGVVNITATRRRPPPPAPIITVNSDSSRASSTSPVPSITISMPEGPEEKQQPPTPPYRTSSAPCSAGRLHPRRAHSLSAGSSSSPPSAGKGAAAAAAAVATDIRAMAVLCGVPEHGQAVNTIRDLKSEIEELNERVELGERREDELAQRERQGRRQVGEREAEVAALRALVDQGRRSRDDEFAALVHKEREGRSRLEKHQTQVARLQAQVEQVGLERDELLRAKRSAVRELDRLKREQGRENRECSVSEHSTLRQRLRVLEREREEAAKARTCSMPVHDEFLRTYAEKVKEMDREILALTARNEKLSAREVCTLPLHKIILQEYKEEVIRMDKEIQTKDKLAEEKDQVIAAAQSSGTKAEKRLVEVAEEQETRAARLHACEERLENHRAKFRKDLQSAIDELARQDRDTDAWIANIARRDLYTREITDEDLENLHKMYRDRTNNLRELKKTILETSEERVERQHEEQGRRLHQWLQKRDEAVNTATNVIERLQMALKERDVEMIALKKGARISIDQSKTRQNHFDLKWELEDKYYGVQVFESRLNHIDQDEMLKRIEEEIGGRMRENGDGVTPLTGEASKD